MRVCIDKLTGKLIESQGGGEVEQLPIDNPSFFDKTFADYEEYIAECEALEAMRLKTLLQNALNAGYIEANIEVKYVTDVEYQAILEANKPVPTYEDLRRAKYPTIEEITVALWEQIIEARPESAVILQAQREAVKLEIPKT